MGRQVLKAIVVVRFGLRHKSGSGGCGVGPPKGAFVPWGTDRGSPEGPTPALCPSLYAGSRTVEENLPPTLGGGEGGGVRVPVPTP